MYSIKMRLYFEARRKAGDLQSNNIFLEVVPVNPPGQTFNMSTFYSDIVRLADDDWSGSAPDIHSLADTVIKKTFVKRTTSRLKFDLGGGVAVGVATYNLLGRAIKPAKTKMAKATNMELKSLRTWIHPVSGAPLLQSDMAKFMNYGSKNIKLLDAEVAHIRGFGDTENSLKLLGFRSASCLKTHHQVKLPQFLYPCEERLVLIIFVLFSFSANSSSSPYNFFFYFYSIFLLSSCFEIIRPYMR